MFLRRQNVIIIEPLITRLMYRCICPLHHWFIALALTTPPKCTHNTNHGWISAVALESAKSQGESKLKSLLAQSWLHPPTIPRFWLFWVNPHYPSQFRCEKNHMLLRARLFAQVYLKSSRWNLWRSWNHMVSPILCLHYVSRSRTFELNCSWFSNTVTFFERFEHV